LVEIAASEQPAFLPPGRYRISGLALPKNAALFGVPGFSLLVPAGGAALSALSAGILRLCGIGIEAKSAGGANANAQAAVLIAKTEVHFESVTITGTPGDAIALSECNGVLDRLALSDCASAAIRLTDPEAMSVRDCALSNCAGDGLAASGWRGKALQILNNRLTACKKVAIRLEGDAQISGNLIEEAGAFGIRLGAAERLGTFTVLNNSVSGARVGIGVSAAGNGYGTITLNLIRGAREGAVRALDGEKLVGPDLARSGSESFRNLAVLGNVAL
jgi:hypothetical protein